MKKFIPVVVAILLPLVCFCGGSDILASFKPLKNVVIKDGQYTIKGSAELLSQKTFKVLPDKKYTVSFKARQIAGKTPSKLYICYQLLDKNGRVIFAEMVQAVPGTETKLSAPVKLGSKAIEVEDASRWKKNGGTVQYNVKKDLSDLPNKLYFFAAPEKIEKQPNGKWLVTMKAPIRRSFPAGIAVRQGTRGGYFIVGGGNVRAKEITFRGFAKGIAASAAHRKFHKGTVQAKIQILANWGKASAANTIVLKDLKFIVE